ncbi:amino acid adenylation domain-containing protein [Paraneptunicella aestuarii]|uniref:non-ribosomal peptide synthetase n=1 Tax=Paraneptunicella aestuarii TaxID=2831148 RepID=UPI001E33553B|nr:non-ribosomal peptide synthetase [Paraneptunicella aestuarii]UAA39460.1 amino acid adenylation domain-containing protein [Paraneptunicella aestuarii]
MTAFALITELHSKGIELWQENGELKLKAPKGVLTEELKQKLISNKSEIVAFLQEVAAADKLPPVRPMNKDGAGASGQQPLSFSQQRLWFIDALQGGTPEYNIPKVFEVKGQPNLIMLTDVFNTIIERHAILRTVYINEGNETFQHARNMSDISFAIKVQDLSHLTGEALQAQVNALIELDISTPFNLAEDLMLRVSYVKMTASSGVMIFNMHHIASDGWSMEVLVKEFVRLYAAYSQGQVNPLPELAIQYADYAHWQRDYLEGEVLESQLGYWEKQLNGLPAVHSLPLDYTRPNTKQYKGAVVLGQLSASIAKSLLSVAKAHELTPFMLLHGALALLLSRHSNTSDIVIGTPVANRLQAELESLIGCFINTLVLRVDTSHSTLSEYFAHIRQVHLDAQSNQNVPFEQLVERLNVPRSTAHSPLIQIMITTNTDYRVSDTSGDAAFTLADVGIQAYQTDFIREKFDLSVKMSLSEQGGGLNWSYDVSLFSAEHIMQLNAHLCRLLEGIGQALDTRSQALHALPMLSTEEIQYLVHDLNNTGNDYPKDKGIHELFIEQVAANPNKTAVVYEGENLTYQQLYEKSTALALYLQSLGVKPDFLVGLCVERSLDMMVGILGILQAGGAYVPLDPDSPDDRLSHMAQDSQCAIILTQQKLKGKLFDIVTSDTHIITLDEQWSEIKACAADLNRKGVQLEQEVTPKHLAYVIYTSGSTGKPKGVMIEHGMIVEYSYSLYSKMDLQSCDTFALISTISADLGNTNLYIPVIFGKTIHLISNECVNEPGELRAYMNAHPIDFMKITPSHFEMFKTSDTEIVAPNKILIFAGEPLPGKIVETVNLLCPDCKVFNNYGPTETTISKLSTTELISTELSRIHLGKPLGNTQVYILDPFNNPVPVGVPGELHIAGAGVARGYLNRPELTKERFVPNPFAEQHGGGDRMYKTGDLVRWLDDGNIEYLGRADTQINIRGFRVETGEIESQLDQHPDIKDCAVVAQGQGSHKRLIAFYVAKTQSAQDAGSDLNSLPGVELKSFLAKSLPEYMLPAAFVNLDAIPLTANGKVDRAALERRMVTLESGQDYLAPRNLTEEKLVSIWAEVLGIDAEKIGVNDNFFELGGHSLLATQLRSRVREQFNVDLPLKALFEQPCIAGFALLVSQADLSDIPAITASRRTLEDGTPVKSFPLSYAQERLWFIEQLEPGKADYNMPQAVTISGKLNVEYLEQAFRLMISRHENLRSVFRNEEGRARLVILEQMDFNIESRDLSQLNDIANREQIAKQLCLEEAAKPFDLANGPLLRVRLLKLAEQEHILLLTMHHIISDGWSAGVMIKEFSLIMAALQKGEKPELPAMSIQYVDYSIWQRALLEQSGSGNVTRLQQQLDYWQKKLKGVPESLELITDYPRPSTQNFAGDRHTFSLDIGLSQQLQSLSEQHSCTLFMTLLTAFNVLLYRYTGQEDICIGSPIANRHYGETEGLIGMFVNTLALRNQLDTESSFQSLLEQVKTTCLEAYEHQDTPFEKVVDAVQPGRNMAFSPLFQVMFVLQNTPEEATDQPIRLYPLERHSSKFDLTLSFTETSQGLVGTIEYRTSLYQANTIARIARHYELLCRAIISSPDTSISRFVFMEEAEQKRLIRSNNETRRDYPNDKCIHELFIQQVAKNPDKAAIVFENQSLSYQQLYDKSRMLALYLQSKGVRPDSLVAVCMDRTLDLLVGMLGILQAGGAYVPLDPSYPDDRLDYMLKDSQVSIVLTQESLKDNLCGLVKDDVELVALDQQWLEIAECVARLDAGDVVLREEVRPHHLAYMIYTSGSTGQPKGVMVEHQGLVALCAWHENAFKVTQDSRATQLANIAFDASGFEIWPYLTNSATVFIGTNDTYIDATKLNAFITENKISHCFLATPVAQLLMQSNEVINPHLEYLFIGGDKLSHYQERDYSFALVNNYGPTETTIVATFHRIEGEFPSQIIGRPISNTQVYILDQHNNPVPVGVPGELHIAGDGVARGYFNRPELTKEKFIPNPFVSGSRMYKSGDLARWLDDGTIEYLGRIDTQVKIRGFRIETGEIEAKLNQHPAVKDCAVVVQERDGDKHLVAYYVESGVAVDDAQVELNDSILTSFLQQSLPQYMLPSAFICIEEIPLTANGKVDRRDLQRRRVNLESNKAYLAPRNATEAQLVDIWAEVLNATASKIGVNDNFFELGGHSLLATQLISRIRARFEVELPLRILFEQGTISSLAPLIEQAECNKIPPIKPVNRTNPDGSAIESFPLSYAQERIWFIQQLEPGSAGYNIPGVFIVSGEIDIRLLEQAFKLIIDRHENLRTVFPEEEGQARQVILDSIAFNLEMIDLSDIRDIEAQHKKARQVCQSEVERPFDLGTGPLIRGKVVKLSDVEHILVLTMHHIVGDGWSVGVMIKEFGQIMAQLQQHQHPSLPALPVQYLDYSVWQRKWLDEDGVLKKQLSYWQQKLNGVPESLNFPTDYSRPAVQDFVGARYTFRMEPELSERLKALSEAQGCSLFMTMLAAFNTLLYLYTGQDDICLGSPIANRQYGEIEGLIGMFANTLALRNQVEAEAPFTSLLTQVKTTCLEAYENQDTPFEKVVDLVQPVRNMALTPLFQIMFVLQKPLADDTQQNIRSYPLDSNISKFDLVASFTDAPDGLVGIFEYRTSLYKLQTMERLGQHFNELCQAIVANPGCNIADLVFIGEAEKQQVLHSFNDTQADYPKNKCLHHYFAEQAISHPDNLAVVYQDETLTYQQLYEKSQTLALYLQSKGVTPDTLVGLCVERSLEMMVGIWGILQAGGAYVPLDPDYPEDRLAYMIEDSQATIILTQDKLTEKLRSLVAQSTEIVTLDQQWSEIKACVNELESQQIELQHEVNSRHLAYVIYTSGSTGKPKGVMVEHQGAVNRLDWMQQKYQIDQNDRVLQKTPFSFDVSVWELVWPMMYGSAQVIAKSGGHKDNDYLVGLINKERVTTLHFVPSMLRVMLQSKEFGQCHSLKQVICSGEALEPDLVREYYKMTNTPLYNLYGPTEASIDVTSYDCLKGEELVSVPIGRPINNIQLYILDKNLQPVPKGVPGELHIAGDGLARGYLNKAELTQEKFINNPFASQSGGSARMYKTGDLARWMDDGNIDYLGRIDDQVKLRGFRIELGEIQSQLLQLDELSDAKILLKEEGERKELVAYIVPNMHKEPIIWKLLQMQSQGENMKDVHRLPKGLPIFCINPQEADFTYEEIFEDECYLQYGITLKDGDCVLDVGANIGVFSMFVNAVISDARIFAFEPLPPIYDALRRNGMLYGDNIQTFNYGISSESGEMTFSYYPHASILSGGYASKEEEKNTVRSYIENTEASLSEKELEELLEIRLETEEFSCRLKTISEVIEENGIESIDLLKVDVEKSEAEILKGIRDEHWGRIRQLVLEVHDTEGRLQWVENLLQSKGYTYVSEQIDILAGTNLYQIYARLDNKANDQLISSEHPSLQQLTQNSTFLDVNEFIHYLQEKLRATLPEFMVPARFLALDKLPLTPNGKVDRRALKNMDVGVASSRDYLAPRNEMEKQLIAIWADVLELEPETIGINDSFFELGGHSLMAVKLIAKINKQFNQSLALTTLFTATSVAAIAEVIGGNKDSDTGVLVSIKATGSGSPMFAVPGAGGNVLPFQALARGVEQPLYGLQAIGLDGIEPPLNSVEETAEINIKAMKSIQPEGPYTLIGHSYGGAVAFEMSKKLLQQGDEIASLTLLDSFAPSLIQQLITPDETAMLTEALTSLMNLYGVHLGEADFKALCIACKNGVDEDIAVLFESQGIEMAPEQFLAYFNVYKANQHCYHTYKPSKLGHEIDVTLYRARNSHREQMLIMDDYGWNELLQSPIKIHDVEADHFTLLDEEHIQQIINRLYGLSVFE